MQIAPNSSVAIFGPLGETDGRLLICDLVLNAALHGEFSGGSEVGWREHRQRMGRLKAKGRLLDSRTPLATVAGERAVPSFDSSLVMRPDLSGGTPVGLKSKPMGLNSKCVSTPGQSCSHAHTAGHGLECTRAP